jgi:HYDIN/CFA65/VesB-like, Ig-like domain
VQFSSSSGPRKLIFLAVLVVAALAFASPAAADVVTNTNDSGAGSLRDAIANTAAGGTVSFAPGVTGTITLTTGALQISKDLTITGPGARSLSVSGNNASRVFELSGLVTVTIQALTITNGQTPDSAFESGGGIEVLQGALLVLEDSTVTGNRAGPATGAAEGGGIHFDPGGTGGVTIRRSTITGNSAVGEVNGSASGGGISGRTDDPGFFTVENSTITGNSATSLTAADGGGIDVFGGLVIRNSTIAYNTVDGPNQHRGGGLFASIDSSPVREIEASIIASNTIIGGVAGDSTDCDTGGDNIDGNDNVVGDSSDCDISGANNILGTSAPGLKTLANNGGPTDTIALMESSPALNHVATTNCPPPSTDQRGLPRPTGGACESGAWEGQLAITLTPTFHDYGTVQLPGQGSTQRFVVANVGELTLTLTSIATSNAVFVIVPSSDPGGCGTTLAPGATCYVDVRFVPAAAGTASGVLVVVSNAGSPSASLVGAAVEPVTPPPPPITPNDPCAPDSKAPKVTITSDQRQTTYGINQRATITTRASDKSGLTTDPSRKREKISTRKTGSFSVRKKARDTCGNRGSATFRYRVVGRPTASIRHVKSKKRGCQPRLVALARVKSPVGLRASQIFIDGKLKVSSKKSILVAKISTRKLRNGRHLMTVAGIDKLGQRVKARARFRISCSSR